MGTTGVFDASPARSLRPCDVDATPVVWGLLLCQRGALRKALDGVPNPNPPFRRSAEEGSRRLTQLHEGARGSADMEISPPKSHSQYIRLYPTDEPVKEEQVEQYTRSHPGKGGRCEHCGRFFSRELGIRAHQDNGACGEMQRGVFEDGNGDATPSEVEEIVDVAGRGGKLFYKVKWKDYPLHWDPKKGPKTIWEHPRHLDNCPALLKQFWDSMDDNPEDDVDRPFDKDLGGATSNSVTTAAKSSHRAALAQNAHTYMYKLTNRGAHQIQAAAGESNRPTELERKPSTTFKDS